MRPLALLSVVVLLAGCPGSIQRISPPRSEPLPEPKEVEAAGDYVHQASGMVFPARIEGFSREKVVQYDEKAYNVSVGYNAISFQGSLVCTVYVYPGRNLTIVNSPPETVRALEQELVKQQLKQAREEIEKTHPDWEFVGERDSTLHPPLFGRTAVYEFTEDSWGMKIKILSTAHVFLADRRWFVKFRITCPEMSADAFAPRISRLERSIRWPKASRT